MASPIRTILGPHPLTSVMQLSVTAASLCVASAAIFFTVKNAAEERNVRLVEIGIGILRVDPEKEKQVGAAREWALDLIDANAGGVKFSKNARVTLLNSPLHLTWAAHYGGLIPDRAVTAEEFRQWRRRIPSRPESKPGEPQN